MILANEFLWVAVSQSWEDRDALTRCSTQMLIFLLTTNKTTFRLKEQSALPIPWTKKTAETIRRLKLSRSSFPAMKTSRVIVETQIVVEAAIEIVKDTQTEATRVTTRVNQVSTSWWKRLDRKSKTRKSSGQIYRTQRATAMNSQPLATVIAVGMVKPSTGQ